MLSDDKAIISWAIAQIHDRNLQSMSRYEFSTYCYLRNILGYKATSKMVVHLYKWIEGEVESPSTKIRPRFFLANLKYIFATAPL
jgi:hypothetical protein